MTIVQTGKLAVDNGNIYYETVGQGEAVVLIHGFGVDRRMWVDQIDVLSQGYEVVAYDLRGFGRSSIPKGAYRHYQDLAALLGHLGIDKATIVGSSLGGRVALDFAIAYPERTAAILTAAGVPSGFDFSRPPGTPPGPNPALLKNTLTLLPAEKANTLRAMVAGYSRWHRKHGDPRIEVDPPAIHRLGEIIAPTLVTVGSRDEPDFHRAADILVRNLSYPQKYVFQGSGHLPNMDAPEDFNRVLLDFLNLSRHHSFRGKTT